MKVRRDDTPEARRYWSFLEKNSEVVASWPEWKRGARPAQERGSKVLNATAESGGSAARHWVPPLEFFYKDLEMSDHIEHPCRACGSLLHYRDGYCGGCWTSHADDFYKADVSRIVAALASKHITVTDEQAKELWRTYSFCWSAGWMCLPESDKELLEHLAPNLGQVVDVYKLVEEVRDLKEEVRLLRSPVRWDVRPAEKVD